MNRCSTLSCILVTSCLALNSQKPTPEWIHDRSECGKRQDTNRMTLLLAPVPKSIKQMCQDPGYGKRVYIAVFQPGL